METNTARTLAALNATNEAILYAKSPEELHQKVCEAAFSSGDFLAAAIFLHRLTDRFGLIDVIERDDRIRFAAQLHQPFDLSRTGEEISDQQIGNAGGGKNFGLAEFRACQTDRARVDQASCDMGRLVTLGMRPPLNAMLPAKIGRLTDIGFQGVQVDARRRGIELVLGSAQGRKGHGGRKVGGTKSRRSRL